MLSNSASVQSGDSAAARSHSARSSANISPCLPCVMGATDGMSGAHVRNCATAPRARLGTTDWLVTGIRRWGPVAQAPSLFLAGAGEQIHKRRGLKELPVRTHERLKADLVVGHVQLVVAHHRHAEDITNDVL